MCEALPEGSQWVGGPSPAGCGLLCGLGEKIHDPLRVRRGVIPRPADHGSQDHVVILYARDHDHDGRS